MPIRQRRANTNVEIVIAAERLIKMLKEKHFRGAQIEGILNEAIYQMYKSNS